MRAHVLVRTRLVLDAAGVSIKHAGWSQLSTPEELRRIAHVVRCEPHQLIGRAGERVESGTGLFAVDAQFGRLIIPRAYLEFDSRRIAPLSLRRRDYHRVDWMNLLLPYCPESFEMLVSSCARCGADLGWRYAWGVGNCDICREIVDPSAEPGLAEATPCSRANSSAGWRDGAVNI